MIDKIKKLDIKFLSDNWYLLRKITNEYSKKDEIKSTQSREAYDRENGEWVALPLIHLAGSKEIGHSICSEIQYPVAIVFLKNMMQFFA